MNNHDTFSYTYSAKEQEEIKAIREKYAAPAEEDSMTKLRRLDRGVTKKATTVALMIGIVGALVMGMGMSFAMTDIGELLGLYRELALLIGIVIGVVGIVLVSLAYPIYNAIVKKERQKIAPEILRLTEELMK